MDIIVLLDGTWNDRDDNTNVYQIRDRLFRSGHTEGNCHYVRGVGVRLGERLRGGIFGLGLDKNIREGYRFIAAAHESDADRIFLIGYSRGASTARSLAGMIAKCGIVSPQRISDEQLFARYRDKSAPGLNDMQKNHALARTTADKKVLAESRLTRIRFIGVFDTVGSLGIPGTIGHQLTRRRYEFHNTNLSDLVDHAYHAVAIDEHRKQFVPTLWTKVPNPMPGKPTVEQRWFVGNHSNVGGGGTRNPEVNNPLSVLTREWIVDRAAHAGLKITSTTPPASAWQGAISDSGVWRLLQLIPGNGPHLRPVEKDATGTTLDDSVRRRWGRAKPPYRPANPGLADWMT